MFASHFARFAFATTFCAALVLALVTAPAQGQTPTTIYTFAGNGEPANPLNSSVAQGRDGNYYFSTCIPTTLDSVLFNITPSGTLTTVYTPINCSAGVTLGTDGDFYGVVNDLSCCGNTLGEVYKVTSAGTATILYTFTGGSDGADPGPAPIEGTNGIFYGVTTSNHVPNSTAYSITSSGTLKTLHTFTGTDGQCLGAQLVQGTDGNFYSQTQCGGTNNLGVIFKMTPTGTVTVLHNFAGSDGSTGSWALMQAKDGNFYGTTRGGGTNGAGVIFKITSSGTYTVLYNFPSTGNQYSGNFPFSGLIQATNGLLYGVTGNVGGPFAWGSIYSFNTTTSTYTTLYNFTGGTDGGQPYGPLLQHTDGLLYGTTYVGGNVGGSSSCSTVEWDGELVGTGGCGTVFTENIGAKAFIRLQTTSGSVGSKVSMFGQGFSSSSVVKFNGVAAAKPTLSGTTYLTATVPAGASDGFVTVTTGTSTLTSTQSYTVHNSWSSGKAMTTGVQWPMTGTIGSKIYVIGGYTATAAVADNQIYNPTTNTWTTGAVLPTAMAQGATAVVNNTLYIFGGSANGGGTVTNATWAYNPTTNKWTSKSAMPTARCSMEAVVEKGIIYVIGGYNGSRLNTVESYNPTTDTWTEESPLLVGKSEIAAGLIGTTIVASGGFASGGVTGDTEGYNATTNVWTSLTADSVFRNGACAGAIGGDLYVSDGNDNSNNALSANEGFNLTKNAWTTLVTMPQVATDAGPAVYNGQLYCFGGSSFANAFRGTIYSNVQIYQP
jgi:uncharacterized repeat protein (TIGR03803 family)